MLNVRFIQLAQQDFQKRAGHAAGSGGVTDGAGRQGSAAAVVAPAGRGLGRMVLAMAATAALTTGVFSIPAVRAVQPAAAVLAAQPSAKLIRDADLFLHYSLLGKEKLANDCGKAFLLDHPTAVMALRAFDAAANGRDVSEILIGNQQNKPLKKVSAAINALLQKGHLVLARNPNRILKAIKVMVDSPRAFVVSRQRLYAAGEFAVPFFIQYLNSPSHASYGPPIVQMMSSLGKSLLNPLVAQLATPSTPEKIEIVQVLGNIGYPQALPYLAEIAMAKNTPPDLRKATQTAMLKIDPTGRFAHLTAAELYLWLAEAYYHNEPSVSANHPNEATNPVWYYDQGLNDVVGVPVPTPIWKDIETMRACEAVLRLDHNNSAAISLWLAADLRREVDLPAGAKDATIKPGMPNAHFYAVAAGPRYLNAVLRMALQEDNSPLVLKTLKALQQTGTMDGLVGTGKNVPPLIQALAYPDPSVRFEAASALARANPAKMFAASDEVIPTLAQAIAQSTKPVALLVDANVQIRNEMKARLRPHYHIITAPSVAVAVTRTMGVPYIELAILPNDQAVAQYQQYAATDYRLEYTPILVMGSASELPKLHAEYVNDPTIGEIPTGATADSIAQAYRDMMTRLGSQNINAQKSEEFAIRAAHELKVLAMNHACVYDVNQAIPALRLALRSAHNQKVIVAVAQTLGQIRNPEAQKILARAALNGTANPEPVRYALFKSLAQSARNLGNHLSAADIDTLIHEVSHTTNAKVRAAAAETLGALNVASNQASKLILQQAR
ncbi:MAG: HEAT repeat domain-containing protein [Phycisphaerae bacterium]